MAVPIIKTPLHCPVCGASLSTGTRFLCGHCGSRLDFDNPAPQGPVVKRGSTPGGRRVIDAVVARALQMHKVDLSSDPRAMERIAEVSERAARELAADGKTVIDLPFIAVGPSGPVRLTLKLEPADLG
ncbi:MAG: Hsp70 family protein [Spirochaetes bacterium]|nr:Hsp70 family protein [Spirochaetota bacterium]